MQRLLITVESEPKLDSQEREKKKKKVQKLKSIIRLHKKSHLFL